MEKCLLYASAPLEPTGKSIILEHRLIGGTSHVDDRFKK